MVKGQKDPKSERRLRIHITRLPKHSLRWTAELLWKLSLHRVTIRYKETLFGVGWIFLQPVALTLIFYYIFHRFAHIPSGNIPYPLFTATGLVVWSITALVVSQSSGSLTGYADLLKRIALPRIVLPLSVIVATLADFAIMGILLIGLFLYYHVHLSVSMLWVVPIFLIHLMLLVGLSFLFSLSTVFLRDIGYAVGSLLQLWFFASPVFYPSSLVPKEFRTLADWNPMTGLIEGYRHALLGGQPPPMGLLIPAVIVSTGILVVGLVLFRFLEGVLPDMM